MKSEIPGEECVSLLYSAAWKEWTGGALLFNPSTMAHQHRETNTPPTSTTTTTTLRRLMDEGLSTSHRNIYGFKFLFWPDRFIVYSLKKFQRPFFYLKIYFPRGEIHFLGSSIIQQKGNTTTQQTKDFVFIYLFISKNRFWWWFASPLMLSAILYNKFIAFPFEIFPCPFLNNGSHSFDFWLIQNGFLFRDKCFNVWITKKVVFV